MSSSPHIQEPPQSGRQFLLLVGGEAGGEKPGRGGSDNTCGRALDHLTPQHQAQAAEGPLGWVGTAAWKPQPWTQVSTDLGGPPSQEPWLRTAPGSSGYSPVTLGGVSSVRTHTPRLVPPQDTLKPLQAVY